MPEPRMVLVKVEISVPLADAKRWDAETRKVVALWLHHTFVDPAERDADPPIRPDVLRHNNMRRITELVPFITY